MLDTGMVTDEHEDYLFRDMPNVISLRDRLEPRSNLGVQTRVIAGAQGYMGTCGSLAWIAPLLGVDTLAVYSEERFLVSHVFFATQAYRQFEAARFDTLDLRAATELGCGDRSRRSRVALTFVRDADAERSGAVSLFKGLGCDSRAAVAVAVGIGIVSFAFRFNTLGGALGGFDNDHFIYLTRTDMLLSGEQPLRDFVDAELRGAWPALTYLLSAWAQQLGGRTLLPEAYLSVGALAVANAAVFLLALDFSKRWSMALLAAATTVAMAPKLYNYPKVLMLALGVWALHAALASPSLVRLGAAAVATVVAALFRHDLGLYLGAATVTALVVRDSW